MPTPSAARALDPRLANVHTLFHPSRFDPDIDYYGAIYDGAVLATRLMNSPQGLQHDYCFYYGKNVPANAPAKHNRKKFPNEPCQYACDKAIGELDQTDIRYVEQQRNHLAERVLFKVADIGASTVGMCCPQPPNQGVRGCNSVICLSRSNIYDKILAPGQSPEDIICLKFLLALTLLHELAHAAHHYLFGPNAFEDFRENSLVSEAGFEYESRLFGQRPQFFPHAVNPDNRICWGIWQSRGGLGSGYSIDKLARNAWKMPKNPDLWTDGLAFIKRLFEDDFWEDADGEYAQHGASALIPEEIALCCRSGDKSNMAKSIPLSIRDLFRDGGPSYTKVKYARFTNPERKVRGPVEYDDCRQAIL